MNHPVIHPRSTTGLVLPLLLLLLAGNCACKKMLDLNPPPTSTNAAVVYSTDATAISAVTGLYYTLSRVALSAAPALANITLYAGLSADELTLHAEATSNTLMQAFYINNLSPDVTGGEIWIDAYAMLFNTNAALQGLAQSAALTPQVKEQLTGECLFIRAFCYFYLVNLYGNVPLLTGTDYKINSASPRAPQAAVWDFIEQDLTTAQTKLSNSFLNATLTEETTERVRPTRWAATALLARTFLYRQKWPQAEAQATQAINSPLFDTTALHQVFLKNSKEAIWQLQPVNTGENTPYARVFVLPATGPTNNSNNPVYLSATQLNAFEAGDKRKLEWVSSVLTPDSIRYYFPYKYRRNTINATSVEEYSTLLRIAEQYLIRAEARAQQNKLTGTAGALADVNYIRARAKLSAITTGTQPGILQAIMQERRSELFTEWGHRWLDLKRTATVNQVMSLATPAKGGSWKSEWAYYPITRREMQYNRALIQTEGYQ